MVGEAEEQEEVTVYRMLNKAKRFANQQRPNVDIALASVHCFCLRGTKAVARRATAVSC